MDINLLIEQIKKLDVWPPAFQEGSPLWDDEYISRHMLKAHLDESHDRASYNKGIRMQVAGNIITKCKLHEGDLLLDLGCGPGLYAQEYASKLINYTGIDISNQSLGYAIAHRGEHSSRINYILGDYTKYKFEKKFDCITMIWCDFGALSPDARDTMLKNIASSLKDDGHFCFDVYAASSPFQNDKNSWRAEENGFWQEGSYLVLERNKYYQTVDTSLHMAIVASSRGTKVYKIWDKRYKKDELCEVLTNAGFKVESIKKGGLSEKQDEMLGVYCRLFK